MLKQVTVTCANTILSDKPFYVGARGELILIIRKYSLDGQVCIQPLLYNNINGIPTLKSSSSWHDFNPPLFKAMEIVSCDFNQTGFDINIKCEMNFHRLKCQFNGEKNFIQFNVGTKNDKLIKGKHLVNMINPTMILNDNHAHAQKNYEFLSPSSILSIQKNEIQVFDLEKGIISKRTFNHQNTTFFGEDMMTVGDKNVEINIENSLEKKILMINSVVHTIFSLICEQIAHLKPSVFLYKFTKSHDIWNKLDSRLKSIELTINNYSHSVFKKIIFTIYCIAVVIIFSFDVSASILLTGFETICLLPITATASLIVLIAAAALAGMKKYSKSEQTRWLADHSYYSTTSHLFDILFAIPSAIR